MFSFFVVSRYFQCSKEIQGTCSRAESLQPPSPPPQLVRKAWTSFRSRVGAPHFLPIGDPAPPEGPTLRPFPKFYRPPVPHLGL
jgi:hypothetical protein